MGSRLLLSRSSRTIDVILRSLNVRFALISLLLLVAIGVIAEMIIEPMYDDDRRPIVVTTMIIGGASFAALAGLLAFSLISRRLKQLALAVEAFVANGFTEAGQMPRGNAAGDEIDRLASACAALAQRIQAQVAKLEEGAAWRRELLANVSHDMRTPLTSIQGYLEESLLRRETLTIDQQRSFLQIAIRHCEGLSRLIADLGQLTSLEAGEVRLRPETFDISELLHDIAQKFRLKAARKAIRLEVDGAVAREAVVGDIALVERLIDNLVENAICYTPSQGVVRLRAQRAGPDTVRVEVADTGPGIDPDVVTRIFERYYRNPRHGASAPEGTGLGLAIARHIALLHGGDLNVETRLGSGTTMSFEVQASH